MLVTVLSSGNTGGHENWGSVIASVPAVLAPPGTLAAPWLPALSACLHLAHTRSALHLSLAILLLSALIMFEITAP